MTTRRGLLWGILASGMAPAVVRASSLMRVRAPTWAVSDVPRQPWAVVVTDERGQVVAHVRYRRSGLLVRTERRLVEAQWHGDRVGCVPSSEREAPKGKGDLDEVTDAPARETRLVTPSEAAAERVRLEGLDHTLRLAAPSIGGINVVDWRSGEDGAQRVTDASLAAYHRRRLSELGADVLGENGAKVRLT